MKDSECLEYSPWFRCSFTLSSATSRTLNIPNLVVSCLLLASDTLLQKPLNKLRKVKRRMHLAVADVRPTANQEEKAEVMNIPKDVVTIY